MAIIKKGEAKTDKKAVEKLQERAQDMTEDQINDIISTADIGKLPDYLRAAYSANKNRLPDYAVKIFNERLSEIQSEVRSSDELRHKKLTDGDADEPVKHNVIYPDRAGYGSTKSRLDDLDNKFDRLLEAFTKVLEKK